MFPVWETIFNTQRNLQLCEKRTPSTGKVYLSNLWQNFKYKEKYELLHKKINLSIRFLLCLTFIFLITIYIIYIELN